MLDNQPFPGRQFAYKLSMGRRNIRRGEPEHIGAIKIGRAGGGLANGVRIHPAQETDRSSYADVGTVVMNPQRNVERAPLRIIVAIPTLNEAPNISRVLYELMADLPAAAMVDFVVADGGSADGTVDIVNGIAADHTNVRLIHNDKKIQSAAVNLIVDHFGDNYDLLLRCDAHAYYPAGFIRRLAASQEQNGADSVVVPMDSEGRTCFQKAVAWISDSKVGSGGSAHRGGRTSGFVDHGHHALFLIEAFREAGGYDPSFTHNEDAEFDCRQRAKGRRIFLDSDIRLRYTPRATPRKLAKQYFNYGRGRSRTVRRHPSSLRARQLAIPVHVGFTFYSLLLAPAFPILWAWPLLYAAILIIMSASVAYRQRSLCGLLVAGAAAIMHFAWGLGFIAGLVTIRESRWAA
jgi:succinoglycan biosynthesis protein ExoA